MIIEVETLAQLKQVTKEGYFAYLYGTIDPKTGKSWCPDCARAEPVVLANVANNTLVKCPVGDRAHWKTPDNPFRTDQDLHLRAIPTLIHVRNDWSERLVEAEVADDQLVKKFFASL